MPGLSGFAASCAGGLAPELSCASICGCAATACVRKLKRFPAISPKTGDPPATLAAEPRQRGIKRAPEGGAHRHIWRQSRHCPPEEGLPLEEGLQPTSNEVEFAVGVFAEPGCHAKI